MTGPALPPETLLAAYAMGIFPMAEAADSPALHWVDPLRRGILPLEGFHISRSLRRHLLTAEYTVTVNHDFAGVMAACAARAETWINRPIVEGYGALHALGHAHSVEVWQDGILAGGMYGVQIGAAFCGESMFSRRTNGSKTALAWAVHRLRAGGFALFDTQFLTPHLASLGGIEISRADYRRRLARAIAGKARFDPPLYQPSPSDVAGMAPSGSTQTSTQTS
ncbi:MAG: leucyl/phenylalanyl-tRNA--protein transferase [Paracoccaceae bacterium]